MPVNASVMLTQLRLVTVARESDQVLDFKNQTVAFGSK